MLSISKDWSVECLYSYSSEKTSVYSLNESLLRLDNISDGTNYTRPHINIVFERQNKENKHGTLSLYVNDNNINSDVQKASIENVSLLNGEIHHICLRRKENKNSSSNLNYYEYTLSVSSISENFYSKELNTAKIETKIDISSKDNIDSKFSIGFYNNYESFADSGYLFNLSYATEFLGKISNFRIYNKSFSDNELFCI